MDSLIRSLPGQKVTAAMNPEAHSASSRYDFLLLLSTIAFVSLTERYG